MRATSTAAALTLRVDALEDAFRHRARGHVRVGRVVEDELLEAGVAPTTDDVGEGLVRAPRRLVDEGVVAEQCRAEHRPPRFRAELVEPRVVLARLGECLLGRD